jgi:hypothetical protein
MAKKVRQEPLYYADTKTKREQTAMKMQPGYRPMLILGSNNLQDCRCYTENGRINLDRV